MKRFESLVRTAAGVPAAVLLSGVFAIGPADAGQAAVAVGRPDPAPVCRITPAVLDVSRPAGPLTVRIDMAPASPDEAIDPGVYIASVNGVRLPSPSPVAEGIGERVAGRRVEHKADALHRSLIVRFDRPSDGNPATREDGDAGDVLAMLLAVPDGQIAPVCVAGRAAGAPFECCDTIVVRNRGLRDLPRGLTSASSP